MKQIIACSFKKSNCYPLLYFFLLLLLHGCSSSAIILRSEAGQETVKNSFYGFVMMDSKDSKTIHNTNGNKYFTPASNLKIVTLFTGLTLLPEQVPVLKYLKKGDTTYVTGTGDPTWLHPYFKDSTAIQFLRSQKEIKLNLGNSTENRYGPGWAWEDYDTYFSPEKSPLPLYGNVVTVSNTDSLDVYPRMFRDCVSVNESKIRREESRNRFYFPPSSKDTLEIPFIVDKSLVKKLLENELAKNIEVVEQSPIGKENILYGIETDSVYKRMLAVSDNFLAEQLLLMASSTLSDTLSTKNAIEYMLENELSDLKNKPRWVDGSGLSRYNLFTPQSMVQILQKLYNSVDENRLFQLFPNWGPSGTIAKWEDKNSQPFIFAKSGYVGNNYNLSGYLRTKSGKLFIFSFMNNHYTVPTAQIRQIIYDTLVEMHNKH